MTVQLFPALDLPAALGARWRQWQAENPVLESPYFHPEFTHAVATVRDDVFVAVLNDGAAFFPFQRERFGVGKPVGGVMSDYHGFIAPPDFICDPVEFVRRCGLRAWDFDHLPAAQTSFTSWQSQRATSPVLDLAVGSQDGPAHLQEQVRRKRSRLERKLGALECEICATDAAALHQLLAWKSTQYQRTGVPDLFAHAWARSVLHEISQRTDDTDFCGMLSTLRAGGRLVAAHFGMRSRNTLHYWFPAYDAAMGEYSPGMILLSEMVSRAPQLGITRIDFGKGDASYKLQLANTAVPLLEGSVIASPALAAMRRTRANAMRWVRASPLLPLARALLRRRSR